MTVTVANALVTNTHPLVFVSVMLLLAVLGKINTIAAKESFFVYFPGVV